MIMHRACRLHHHRHLPRPPREAAPLLHLPPASDVLDSIITAALDAAVKQYGVDLVTQVTTQLAQNTASGDNELWFRSFDDNARCGEINAAPYMPAALFEPRNFLKLLAYAAVTVRLYRTPVLNTAVELGRCAGAGYGVCGAGVQGIGWTPNGLMGPVCGERCRCNFQGACSPAGRFPGFPSCSGLPSCRDVPDDPRAGEFCSLCSPSTACPDCVQNTVTIGLCYPPESPEPTCDGPAGTPCPPGARSSCTDGYGTYVSCGPPPPGAPPSPPPGTPPRPPAPTPAPDPDAHLWFRLVQPVRFGSPENRCGEVDAAPRMPAGLFERRNRAALALYTQVTLSGFDIPGLEAGRCIDIGYGVLTGSGTAVWDPSGIMNDICATKCDCSYKSTFERPNVGGCDNIPDDPSSGTWCSLCGDNTYNSPATIDFYREGVARPGDHLYFYYVNQDLDRCGEVDAAPYMPASLFEPRHALALAAYVEATVRLYSIKFRQGIGSTQTVTVQRGRCETAGYSQPQTTNTGGIVTSDAQWAPTQLMGPTCNEACACRWSGQQLACHGHALNNPDNARICSMPYCDDAELVDDSASGKFCSLCGMEPGTAPIRLYERPHSGH